MGAEEEGAEGLAGRLEVSIFSSLALALVSGFGGLLTWYIPIYAAAGATYGQ